MRSYLRPACVGMNCFQLVVVVVVFFFVLCWGKKKPVFACRLVDCPFQLAQKYVEMVEDDRNHLLLISNVERCLGLTANEIHKPHVEHKSILLSYYAQNCFKKEGT